MCVWCRMSEAVEYVLHVFCQDLLGTKESRAKMERRGIPAPPERGGLRPMTSSSRVSQATVFGLLHTCIKLWRQPRGPLLCQGHLVLLVLQDLLALLDLLVLRAPPGQDTELIFRLHRTQVQCLHTHAHTQQWGRHVS